MEGDGGSHQKLIPECKRITHSESVHKGALITSGIDHGLEIVVLSP